MEFESAQVSASWCELESSSLDLVRAENFISLLSHSLMFSPHIYMYNIYPQSYTRISTQKDLG